MLSFKYIYRNLVKLGRPADHVIFDQPQLESFRHVPMPARCDFVPLTQVRRSLITVYKSGRTGSKMIDHVTRAVYKEWRYRSSEYPDLKSPLQTACSSIASGVNSTDFSEMEAVNGLIEKVHGLLISMGFLPETAFHLIAVLIVIEASPHQVFSKAPMLLPKSLGTRNPMFPKEKEMKPYRIHIVDEVYLCTRFMESNNDIRLRMLKEWDLFRATNSDYTAALELLLRKHASDRVSLKNTLESVISGRDLGKFPPTFRPYILALVLQPDFEKKSACENRIVIETGAIAGEASIEMAVDGNVAGHKISVGTCKALAPSKSLLKKLTRNRPIANQKLCVP